MRDPDEVRTQVKHSCGRGETAAELPAVAVAGPYVTDWYSAG
jgi:hypothetical protein